MDRPLASMIETHRSWVTSSGQEGEQLDLSGLDMRSLESLKMEVLTAIKAVKTRFFGMNLYKIEMQSANLDDSDFRRCDMEEADLRGSSFRRARLNHANLQGANFAPLMFGSRVASKKFSPSDFEDASLSYADFTGCKMKSANFKNADLTFANFTNADLRDADFTGAKIDNVIFEGAMMEEVVMKPERVFKLNIKDNND